jgi:hypothetical protein
MTKMATKTGADALRQIFCALVLLLGLAPAARAAEYLCLRPAEIDRKSPANIARVRDYRPIFRECHSASGVVKLAIRQMSVDRAALLLLVDPATLETSVARAACWNCDETSDKTQQETRYIRAVDAKIGDEGRSGTLQNVGLAHGVGGGAFLTGDLCPSKRPLDRAFLNRLVKEGADANAKTPVALAVSGLWLVRHSADFAWLQEKTRAGSLDIIWVNHSYHHPYVAGRPDGRTYLLTQGIDLQAEILDTERLLIALDATPSVFFRFPGLVANGALLEQLRRYHLIALGADSWLALGPTPHAGSIVLVHPNGNEPAGLRVFSHLLEGGKLPRPFRAINDAP